MRDLCRDLPVVPRCARSHEPRTNPTRPGGPAVECLEGRLLMAAVVYEAESATLTGATVSRSPGGFSGAGYVDYRNPSGDSVEWTVGVDADGGYALAVRYANGKLADRPLELAVDGVVTGQVSFPFTGEWADWATVTRHVQLSAGTHTVRLTAVGWSGPNVDALAVEASDLAPDDNPPPPPPGQTLEAEDADFDGADASRSNAGYSGSGYVDFAHASGDYVEWSVDAAEAGAVGLRFRYANGSTADRPLELRVNGQVVEAELSFVPTGGWSKWQAVTADVTLASGANTVRLTAVGKGGPNVDATLVPVAPGQSDEILSLRVYHIGNSLTNGINYASLDKMAAEDGREYVFGRHVISGAPLSWIWDHPDGGNRQSPFERSQISLAKDPWDVLTLEPFERQLYQADGSGDVQVAQKFINLALSRSPKLTTYIYQRWPRRTQNADGSYSYDFEKLWLRTYTGKWDLTNETRDYFNQVVEELRKAYPKDPDSIRMVPVGDVMFELNRRIEAGKVPGIDSIQKLFADGIHLTNWGAFLIGTTFYATLYQRDPRGLDFHAYDVVDDPWDSKIDEGFARVVQQVAWDVVEGDPFTGV